MGAWVIKLLVLAWAVTAQTLSATNEQTQELRFKEIYRTPPFPKPIWTSTIPGPGPLYLTALAASHNGKWVASAAPVLRLHKAKTGAMIASFDAGTNGDVGTKIIFTPNDAQILSLSRDSALLWDIKTKKLVRHFDEKLGGLPDAALSPDGKLLLTAAGGRPARLWDVKTGNLLFTYERVVDGVAAVAISPDGNVAACADSRTIRVWRLADRSDVKVRAVGKYDLEIRSSIGLYIRESAKRLNFAKDSSRLLFVGNNTACVWDWQNDKVITRIPSSQIIGQAITDPTGHYAMAGQVEYLKIWELETGNLVAEFCHSQRTSANDFLWVMGVAYSPDGNTAYSGLTPTIKAWTVKSVR